MGGVLLEASAALVSHDMQSHGFVIFISAYIAQRGAVLSALADT